MDEINKGGLFMKTVVDKANTRGYANHGWLKTHHTFSTTRSEYILACFGS